MAESRSLPTGFGELEVLPVGMVLLVESLAGLRLNSLTILSFCKNPEFQTPSHLLVLSLALLDSGISLNAIIAATSSLLWSWPCGSDGCQAHSFQGFAAALASICNSATIAWESYHHYYTHVFGAPGVEGHPCSEGGWEEDLLSVSQFNGVWVGNFTSFLFIMAFFNFLLPLFITLISYWLMKQKLGKTGHPQVNTNLPVRMLLLGWGPYTFLYLYVAITDVTLISPKLQMIPALVTKMVPIINTVNYALGSDIVHRGIWQCLSPKRSEQD